MSTASCVWLDTAAPRQRQAARSSCPQPWLQCLYREPIHHHRTVQGAPHDGIINSPRSRLSVVSPPVTVGSARSVPLSAASAPPALPRLPRPARPRRAGASEAAGGAVLMVCLLGMLRSAARFCAEGGPCSSRVVMAGARPASLCFCTAAAALGGSLTASKQ
jgi:hypothetical protein